MKNSFTLRLISSLLVALLTLTSVLVTPIIAQPMPGGGGQGGTVRRSEAVQGYTYQLLKLATTLAADGSGDVIVERRLANVDMQNWTSDTWYFDWYPGHYSQIRAWDEQGPLGVSTSQSGTRIFITVYFRQRVQVGQTYHFFLALTIENMASMSGNGGRASWYWSPGQPVQAFVQAINFPPNSTFQSVSPAPTVQAAAYLEWRCYGTSTGWQSTVDVSYTIPGPNTSSVVGEARLDIGMPSSVTT